MTLAKSLPHKVAECRLIRFGSFRALEIKRFDRRVKDPTRVLRRHVIDACQALGVPSTMKYERNFGDGKDVAHIRDGVSFKKLFGLWKTGKKSDSFFENLFDWLIFNLIVGNSDAHGKNFSFFVNANGLAPTPWYDLISVLLVEGIEHSLAMSVGDEFDPNEVHALQLLYEADEVGLSKAFVQDRLNRVLDCLDTALNGFVSPEDLSVDEKAFVTRYLAFINERVLRWRSEATILEELTEI